MWIYLELEAVERQQDLWFPLSPTVCHPSPWTYFFHIHVFPWVRWPQRCNPTTTPHTARSEPPPHAPQWIEEQQAATWSLWATSFVVSWKELSSLFASWDSHLATVVALFYVMKGSQVCVQGRETFCLGSIYLRRNKTSEALVQFAVGNPHHVLCRHGGKLSSSSICKRHQ